MNALAVLRRHRRLVLSATCLSLLLGAGMGGCVNQDAYDRLVDANRQLQSQNQELLDRNRALEEANRTLTTRVGEGDMTKEQMAAMMRDLEQQLNDKNRMLAEFDSRFKDIKVGTLLDPETDAALKDLAARYPQLLSYDANRGMVRFNSDITFNSGDFKLTSDAERAIGEFARLLRDIPTASQYDLRVIGHTDSQPVTQRAGRRFTNNDELSAFRAIQVANAFSGNGIPREKVEFAGFGEHRPAVAQSGNVPANRRVEVYLVKSTWNGTSMPANPVRASAPTAPAKPVQPATPRGPDFMK